jgi:predicted phage terminase large subunit-like protein
MDRAAQWLRPTAARWSERRKAWVFPSKATLAFGYLETENDKYRYYSSEFQYIGFDEVTQFSESQYRFIFSRRRRLKDSVIPLRTRAASNPGGPGHNWVKQRFLVEGRQFNRPFIPAKLRDNPYLDHESYLRSLSELDPVTRQQLIDGDWSARQEGSMFRREWFQIAGEAPQEATSIRFWDFAGTKANKPKSSTEPDWTAGCFLSEYHGVYYIEDMKRIQGTPLSVEDLVRQTAELDGYEVPVYIEQEPGASGVHTIDHYQRHVLKGFTCKGLRTTGSKIERARPVSSAAEAGNIKLVMGTWINTFLDEIEAFPNGSHDDQVDTVSGAFEVLRHSTRVSVPGHVSLGIIEGVNDHGWPARREQKIKIPEEFSWIEKY